MFDQRMNSSKKMNIYLFEQIICKVHVKHIILIG